MLRKGWIVVLALAVCVPTAASANRARLNDLVKEAEGHYRAGRYKQSAETLLEAHDLSPHPRLIYNIARSYDQANELDLAMEYYQRYVNAPKGTDPTLLKRAALSIDRLRGLISQRDEAQKREAEEQARLAQEAQTAQQRAEQEAEAKRAAEAQLRANELATVEARQRTRSRNRVLALIAGGVAVAGLGTGTGFGVMANGAKSDFRQAETVEAKNALQARTRSNAFIADVGFGLGIVAAAAAVFLYPKGAEEPPASAEATGRVSVSVIPARNGAGLEVRF